MKSYVKNTISFSLGAFLVVFLFLFGFLLATDPGDNLHLVEANYVERPSGERVVTGTIANNTDRSYPRVFAEIDVYDSNGNVVESTYTTKRDLAASEQWSFEIQTKSRLGVKAVVHGRCGREYVFEKETTSGI